MLCDVSLRTAKKEDIDQIVALYDAHMQYITKRSKHFEAKMSSSDFKKCIQEDIDADDALVVVGEHKSQIVGFLLGYIVRSHIGKERVNVGYIEQGYVLPKFCRTGLIVKGIALAKDWFKKSNVAHIISNVNTHNEFSMKVLKKAGFKERTIRYVCEF